MSILIEAFFKKENIYRKLQDFDIEDEERKKLLDIADEIAHLRLLQAIMDRLEKEDKFLFLTQLREGTAENLIMFLRERIEGVEEVLKGQAEILESEILGDIESLKEVP